MARPHRRRNPAGQGGARESDHLDGPIASENSSPAPTAQPAFGVALTAWARKRGERLAAEYLQATEQGEATAWFDGAIASEKLLLRLRATAQAAFLQRVAAAEAPR